MVMVRTGIWSWVVGVVMLAAPVAAQDAYPNRPVRWVVPFPAGGPTDTLSRILAAKLGEQWGQSVVVENKGGASGAIGSDFAAKSPPDGYTLILGTQSTHGSNLIFFPNLPYDPIKDFQPLTLIGTACMALVIAPSVPANTPKELVEWISEAGWRRELRLGRTLAARSTLPPSFWSSAPASRPRTCLIAAARRPCPT